MLNFDGRKGIHLIGTRIYNEQDGCDETLKAKLQLFQHICLQSMINQDTQKFLWLIYVTPNVEEDIKKLLKDLVRDFPNFGVIFTDDNLTDTLLWKARRHILNNVDDLEIIALKENNSLDFVLTTNIQPDEALHQSGIRRIQLESQNSGIPQVLCYKTAVEWSYISDNWKGMLDRRKKDECRLCLDNGFTLYTNYEEI
eukprot:UN31500